MPAESLQTDALVLVKRPPAEAFQMLSVFSREHGTLTALQRIPKKAAATVPLLDLFDHVALLLESSNQRRTWFVTEARILTRHTGIGRSYESLRLAAAFGALVARNTVDEDSRAPVATLVESAFAAFAAGLRPDIVYFKSVYRFARDEGYPVKQQWFPTLPAADRTEVARLLNQPLVEQTAEPAVVVRLQRRLDEYLRGHTEILVD